MLNELQPDLRELLELVRKTENFDATVAAARAAGRPIEPTPEAQHARQRNEQRISQLREKWSI